MPVTIMGGGGEGSGSTPSFRIASFTNNRSINELGTSISSITFDMAYLNGSVSSHSIAPLVGSVPVVDRAITLSGQDIMSDMTFTLTATSDTGVTRTATTQVKFFAPVWYGTVLDNITFTQLDVKGMTKRVNPFTNFTATLNITNEFSCFASPMTNPITDIKEKLFGLSILDTYNVINNFPITLADGSILNYRIHVKKLMENTLGNPFSLDIIF